MEIEQIEVRFYCGCYKTATSLVDEPEECTEDGSVWLSKEQWDKGYAQIRCPSCRTFISQMADHFEPTGKTRIIYCDHQEKTHFEDWPDGELEVCDVCGMSRQHWEQGETPWTMIENIPKARKDLQTAIDKILKTPLKLA